jgi:flagellar hook protein FlgE
MGFSIASTLSALRAFETKMAVTADNVANTASENFRKSRAMLEEGRSGRVELRVQRTHAPEKFPYDGKVREAKEGSNVDLMEEIPLTIPIQRGFEANLKMLETQEEMLGTVLDIVT